MLSKACSQLDMIALRGYSLVASRTQSLRVRLILLINPASAIGKTVALKTVLLITFKERVKTQLKQ
jgi:hypothetical protein